MGAGWNYLLKVANGPLAIWVAYWLLGFYLAVVNSTIGRWSGAAIDVKKAQRLISIAFHCIKQLAALT